MSVGRTSPRPAPQIASAGPAYHALEAGSSASPTRPPARRMLPPTASRLPGSRVASGRTARAASGSRLTTAAPARGPKSHTVTIIRTARNSAPTSAAKRKTSAMFAAVNPRGRAPVGGVGSSTRRSAPKIASAATGAWAKKIARQSNSSVRSPPAAGPNVAPSVPAVTQTAIPRPADPHSPASSGSEPARSIAPPRP